MSSSALLALFALLGALQTFCFDRQPSTWLQWFLWAPLVWLALERTIKPSQAFFASWLCGTVFWAMNVSWIAHSIGVHGGVPLWIAVLLLLLLAMYLGTYWAAFVMVGRLVVRAFPKAAVASWLTPAVLASLWVLLEVAREWMISGFPWTPLGESLVRVTGGLEASAWIGVRGLSFLVLLVNAALAQWAVLRWSMAEGQKRSPRQLGAKPAAMVAAVCVLVTISVLASARFLAPELNRPGARAAFGEGRLPIKIVQPNVAIGAPPEAAIRSYQRLLRLSKCEGNELILWPESAAFPRTWQRHRSLRREIEDVLGGDCDLLFNTAWEENPKGEIEFSNTALLLTQIAGSSSTDSAAAVPAPVERYEPSFHLQRYDKIHLVPYGEYVPLREVLPFVSQLARNVGEFQPGSEIRLLQWRDGVSIAMSICFEILFPKEVAARARSGATLLATLTNDAWFGDTAGPHQHLVSARFRAAENRLPLLFAGVTGVSAAIDGRGRVIEKLPLNSHGVITLDLERDLFHSTSPRVTLYGRTPWIVEAVCVLFILVGLTVPRIVRV